MDAAGLAYDDLGTGPAVVLIHGHPFNRSMWAPQLDALRADFRVIVPDLRGYGDSPVTPGTVSMAQLAGDVAHLLTSLGVGPAALVGLSMGGLIVMELATAEPSRWWALGFIATTAEPVTEAERADRRAKAQTAEEQGMGPMAADMAGALFGPGASAQLRDQITTMMLASSPLGAAAAVRGRADRPDYRPRLRDLATPSFVCAGDRDTFSTAEVTSNLAGCLREPEVLILGDIGHLPNLERPGEFNDRLCAFLARTRP